MKEESQAATLIMNMEGKPESVAIQLNHETLSVKGGVALLIKELDKLYEKDATQSVFTAIDSFLGYSRPDDVSMEEYTREFNQCYKHMVQTRGKDDLFEDGIRAYFLLQQANLSNNQKVLIRATVSDLSYNNMEDQLKRTYGEDITSSASSSSLSSGSSMGAKSQSNKIGGIGSSSSRPNSLNIKVKEEPTYFQQGPSEEYLQPSEEYVYPCDDREFSGYESEFDQLTGEPDYDEPQIDQSEQEDQGIYYQHGMNQIQQSFYSQRPPFRCSGRGGCSQRPVSP